MSTEPATSRRTLTPKFWLWRCDNCGLLAYPPEGDEAAEPHVDCPCWKGPRWVRYFAMTPSTPESRDAARRAKALGASVVETVAEAVARGAIPHPPAGKIVSPEAPHYFGPDGSGNATGANIGRDGVPS